MLTGSTDPKAIGRVAAYEIYAVLGRGSMGIVLDAFDTVLHRRVAINGARAAACDEPDCPSSRCRAGRWRWTQSPGEGN
jgi:hypothetical protein